MYVSAVQHRLLRAVMRHSFACCARLLFVSSAFYLFIWGPIFEKSYDEFTIVKS